MRQLPVIISLLGAGILVLIFLFSGAILWPGSPPAMSGPLSGETPVVSPAHMTSPPSAAIINLTPSPSQALIRIKTTPATPVPGEKSTTPGTSRITPAAAGPYAISTTDLEQQVHNLINQQRTGKDLGALSFDPVLAEIARKHSEDMATRNYFDHVNPAGQNPTARGLLRATVAEKIMVHTIRPVLRKISFRIISIRRSPTIATARRCMTGIHRMRLRKSRLPAG